MKAIDRSFTKIINGTTQFVIPVFQRDYRWTEAQCEQLWNDIVAIANEEGDRSHFIGSVVYISTGDTAAGFTRWLLIDGQQRLTTLTLLLIALRDYIKDNDWSGSDEGPTARRVDAYFLKNVEEEGSRRHKLVLRRHDQATLEALLDGKEMPNKVSINLRENFEYFQEQLSATDPELIYKGIGRLIVVDVTLHRGVDDPQLIFESLNSTGIDLTQSDLIRNFILMRLPEREQTRLYEEYWNKIESLFRGFEKVFDAFIRDFIALRTQASKQEKTENIYSAFRREFATLGSEPIQLDAFLRELLQFARYHAAFSIGTDVPDALREPFARLRRLVDVPAILIMRLYECYEKDRTLSSDEFVRATELIESYVFRRAICGEQTRGYWQIFAALAGRIDNSQPFNSLAVGLARQRDSSRFPDDVEFAKALEERDVYGKRVCFDLLDRLENFETKEPTNTSKYSIEHIMPQNEKLSLEWREMLGQDWAEVQRQWLHRLGNLTLTGYNSTYSDRSFDDKKSIPGGFNDSSVRLNKYIREQPAWTAANIQHRGELLAKRALSIWPALSVDKKLIAAAREADMRLLARQKDTSKVPMNEHARELFMQLRSKLLELDANIIELAEKKSVSYHAPGPTFFLEVLPRKNRLTLVLPLDLNEVDDPLGVAKDAAERKFFANAVYEGGVYIPLWQADQIDNVIPMIRQSYALAKP